MIQILSSEGQTIQTNVLFKDATAVPIYLPTLPKPITSNQIKMKKFIKSDQPVFSKDELCNHELINIYRRCACNE